MDVLRAALAMPRDLTTSRSSASTMPSSTYRGPPEHYVRTPEMHRYVHVIFDCEAWCVRGVYDVRLSYDKAQSVVSQCVASRVLRWTEDTCAVRPACFDGLSRCIIYLSYAR